MDHEDHESCFSLTEISWRTRRSMHFLHFPEDALVRINPKDISKKGSVPTNGSIFFTIFQTFMSGPDGKPYFGEYPYRLL